MPSIINTASAGSSTSSPRKAKPEWTRLDISSFFRGPSYTRPSPPIPKPRVVPNHCRPTNKPTAYKIKDLTSMPSPFNTAVAGPSVASPSKAELKTIIQFLDVALFFEDPLDTVPSPRTPNPPAVPIQRLPNGYTTHNEYKQASQLPTVPKMRLHDGRITQDRYFAGLKAHCGRLADRQARRQRLRGQRLEEELSPVELWGYSCTEEELEVKRVCDEVRLQIQLMEGRCDPGPPRLCGVLHIVAQ